jgi:hypothetical protein
MALVDARQQQVVHRPLRRLQIGAYHVQPAPHRNLLSLNNARPLTASKIEAIIILDCVGDCKLDALPSIDYFLPAHAKPTDESRRQAVG